MVYCYINKTIIIYFKDTGPYNKLKPPCSNDDLSQVFRKNPMNKTTHLPSLCKNEEQPDSVFTCVTEAELFMELSSNCRICLTRLTLCIIKNCANEYLKMNGNYAEFEQCTLSVGCSMAECTNADYLFPK